MRPSNNDVSPTPARGASEGQGARGARGTHGARGSREAHGARGAGETRGMRSARWILAALAIAWLIDIAHAADARTRNAGPDAEPAGVQAFRDVASVLTSPRCLNCHVPGDAPLQGDDNHRHTMNVKRGPDGRGTPAMRCGNCHQAANTMTAHAPPGVEGWRLPPPEMRMAWQGLTPDALCRTLKDPQKTGGRTLAQLLDHVAQDHLVAWAWDPGPGRSRPPLTHEQFAARFRAWTEQGAPCPSASTKEAR
jgi:hypothetical protein